MLYQSTSSGLFFLLNNPEWCLVRGRLRTGVAVIKIQGAAIHACMLKATI